MKKTIIKITKISIDVIVTTIIWILITIEEFNHRSRWFQIDHPVATKIIFLVITFGGLLSMMFSLNSLGIFLVFLAFIIAFQITHI